MRLVVVVVSDGHNRWSDDDNGERVIVCEKRSRARIRSRHEKVKKTHLAVAWHCWSSLPDMYHLGRQQLGCRAKPRADD
jgi:hypothetical protein